MKKKGVCWYSGGVTSTVATKIILEKTKDIADIEIIFFETGQHHSDNERFLKECEDWFGQKIKIMKNDKFIDAYDVLEKRKYVNGPKGAPCTFEMKKKLRQQWEKINKYDFQVFGFEYETKEINRAIRFTEQYPEAKAIFPLIEAKIDKKRAMQLMESNGIKRPKMYDLGYTNNNCIGCVKGGMGYWNKIRKDFPEVFQRMSDIEQEVGASCLKEKDKETGKVKKLFLKDLDPERGREQKPITSECGVVCAVEFTDLISKDVERVKAGEKVLPILDDFLTKEE